MMRKENDRIYHQENCFEIRIALTLQKWSCISLHARMSVASVAQKRYFSLNV